MPDDISGRSDSDIAIKAVGLTKSFAAGKDSPVTVLDGISFEVPRGAIVSFLGHNGAGKTTLTERPGLPVRIIVNRDLVLRPYQPLFFNRGASQ